MGRMNEQMKDNPKTEFLQLQQLIVYSLESSK